MEESRCSFSGAKGRIGLVVKLRQYVVRVTGKENRMSSHLANGNGYAERRGIEREIDGCEFLLVRIEEERSQLAMQLAEYNLIRRLLISRDINRRTRSRNLTQWVDRDVRQQRASR